MFLAIILGIIYFIIISKFTKKRVDSVNFKKKFEESFYGENIVLKADFSNKLSGLFNITMIISLILLCLLFFNGFAGIEEMSSLFGIEEDVYKFISVITYPIAIGFAAFSAYCVWYVGWVQCQSLVITKDKIYGTAIVMKGKEAYKRDVKLNYADVEDVIYSKGEKVLGIQLDSIKIRTKQTCIIN